MSLVSLAKNLHKLFGDESIEHAVYYEKNFLTDKKKPNKNQTNPVTVITLTHRSPEKRKIKKFLFL